MEKKQRGYLIQFIFLLILIGFGLWREHSREREVRKSVFLMDTLVEINVSGRMRNLPAIVDSVIEMAENYEKQFSFYNEESLLGRINSLQERETEINEEFFELLTQGEKYYRLTGGRYDLTVGVLSEIWDIEAEKIPDSEEINSALALTGMDKIVYDKHQIKKPKGMKLNLGSIAKGYIVDKITEFLQARGVEQGLINAGGDLRFWGLGEILIGIQHPREARGETIDNIKVSDKAVVTSGDYERSYFVNGKRYHHIIDAQTGYPASECISSTVIAHNAETADALSTAAFLLPVAEAIEMVNSIDGAEVIIYYINEDRDIERQVSENAADYLEN